MLTQACGFMAPGPSCSGNACSYQYHDRTFVQDAPLDLVLHQLPWVPDPAEDCCNPVCEPDAGPWYDEVSMCGAVLIGVDAVLDLYRWDNAITVDTADVATRETIFAVKDGEPVNTWSGCLCGIDWSRPSYKRPEKIDLGVTGSLALNVRPGEVKVTDWFDTSYQITGTCCAAVSMSGPLFLTDFEDLEFPAVDTASGGRLHFGAGGRVVDSTREEVRAFAGQILRYRVLDVLTVSATGGALIECDDSGVAITLPQTPLSPVDVVVKTTAGTRRLRIQVCPATT